MSMPMVVPRKGGGANPNDASNPQDDGPLSSISPCSSAMRMPTRTTPTMRQSAPVSVSSIRGRAASSGQRPPSVPVAARSRSLE